MEQEIILLPPYGSKKKNHPTPQSPRPQPELAPTAANPHPNIVPVQNPPPEIKTKQLPKLHIHKPSTAADPSYLSQEIINNPVIDDVYDPLNEDYCKAIAYYKSILIQYPYLGQIYPIHEIKGKKYEEVVTDIRMHISLRTSDILIVQGFKTVNSFVETAVTRGGVDITGYAEMVSLNPEIRELLMIIRIKHQDKLLEMSPEMKLMGSCVMTAMTCFSLNRSKQPAVAASNKDQIKQSFLKTFATKPKPPADTSAATNTPAESSPPPNNNDNNNTVPAMDFGQTIRIGSAPQL